MEQKKLYKSSTDKAIFGVCGGFAEYFGIDSLIVRLVLVLFTLAYGAGLFFYIVAAILMPKRPEDGGPQVWEQPAQPGAYNAEGTVYVNRASEPMPQDVTRATVEEPANPVERAWQKEFEAQQKRGAAEPTGPQTEKVSPQPQAKRSYQAYETYQQPRQTAQKASGQTSRSGDHTRTVLGIILILLGVFVLIRVFLPYFDTRILFAIFVILAGGFLIAKKN